VEADLMRQKRSLPATGSALAIFTVVLIFATGALTQETVLHSFAGPPNDGDNLFVGLVSDASGNLYGTTENGGVDGTAFELTLSNGAWIETVIHNFTGPPNDGSTPSSGLVFDKQGNLYGTASYGGSPSSNGVVFELSPVSGGGWTETILYSFLGSSDGYYPQGDVVFDQLGNLYGTTRSGGVYNTGTVFELTPSNGHWTKNTIYSFDGLNGGNTPNAGLVIDAKGSLYGTASGGGVYGWGGVFRLTPSNGGWTATTLFNFTGGNTGALPLASVLLDKQGNLYGTTQLGGTYAVGTIFRLKPTNLGEWAITILHSFTGANDGGYPEAPVLFDRSGRLYTTTFYGGYYERGTLLRLTPRKNGKWNETVLYDFTGGDDGGNPAAGVILKKGNLYGTTVSGGADNLGTVYEMTP
jgi:uncharacterized repeat protein (TIGR03803 family)